MVVVDILEGVERGRGRLVDGSAVDNDAAELLGTITSRRARTSSRSTVQGVVPSIKGIPCILIETLSSDLVLAIHVERKNK